MKHTTQEVSRSAYFGVLSHVWPFGRGGYRTKLRPSLYKAHFSRNSYCIRLSGLKIFSRPVESLQRSFFQFFSGPFIRHNSIILHSPLRIYNGELWFSLLLYTTPPTAPSDSTGISVSTHPNTTLADTPRPHQQERLNFYVFRYKWWSDQAASWGLCYATATGHCSPHIHPWQWNTTGECSNAVLLTRLHQF